MDYFSESRFLWREKNILKLSVYRFLRYTNDMPVAHVRNSIFRAFRVWSDETPLTFTEVMDGRADIMIDFASYYHHDGFPFDGPGKFIGQINSCEPIISSHTFYCL